MYNETGSTRLTKRSVTQLSSIVTYYVGVWKATILTNYGCYCGTLGGRGGTPLDNLDR